MDSDKTNELDSYGVWVKKPVNESTPDDNPDESFEVSADLPDFSSLDDIPDLSTIPESPAEAESFISDNEGDTSLSLEELTNLTTNTDIVEEEQQETPEVEADTEIDVAIPQEEAAPVTDEPAAEATETETETTAEEDDPFAGLSLDEPAFDEAPLGEEQVGEEAPAAEDTTVIEDTSVSEDIPVVADDTEEPVIDTVNEDEITLPEMPDDLVNLTEETETVEAANASDTTEEDPFAGHDLDSIEQLPLDIADLDTSSDTPVAEVSETEETAETIEQTDTNESTDTVSIEDSLPEIDEPLIEDPFAAAIHDQPEETEAPQEAESSLDDFSFDDIPVQTNVTEDDDPFASYDEVTSKAEQTETTEEPDSIPSLDEDFPDPFTDTGNTTDSGDAGSLESLDDISTTESADSEADKEVSLDDFFNDEPAAETDITEPVVSDEPTIESEPVQEDSLSEPIPDTFDEETAMFTDTISEEDEVPSDNGAVEPIIAEEDSFQSESSPESEALILQQIQKELSSLRNEISVLKSDLATLKTTTPSTATTQDGEVDLPKAEENEPEDTGFFGDTGDDDLIALSGDEMSNILNSSQFSTEEAPAQEPAASEEPDLYKDEPEVVDSSLNVDFDADDSLTEPEINITPEEPAEEPTEGPSSLGGDILVESASDSEDLLGATTEEAPALETPVAEPTAASTLSPDLTQNIKSVLSYMDKLLENLPDDKIQEFAKSEQYTVYKNLFTQLGLA